MKNPSPIYGVALTPQIQIKYNSKILLTINPQGDILITDLDRELQMATKVPTGSTLIDIIQTIEDCLPLNESNSQATGN